MEGPRIVYVGGWATHRHVGDDAILRTHLVQLATHLPHARPVVLGADPAILRDRFGVAAAHDLSAYLLAPDPPGTPAGRPLMLRRMGALVAAADGRGPMSVGPGVRDTLELICGAAALVDLGAGSLASEFSHVLWSQAAACAVAAAAGVPRIVSGVTVGPVSSDLDRLVLGRLLRGAASVTVRDRTTSSALARELGAIEAIEAIDDAVSLPRAPVAVTGRAPYAVLCAAPATAESLAPAVAALAADHGLPTVAFAMDFYPGWPDAEGLEALRNALPDAAALEILDPVPSDAELAGIVAGARVAVGSRYHLAVFAAAGGTPAVLLWGDDYTRVKAQGLASVAPGVVPVARHDGPAALVGAVESALAGPRPRPVAQTDPLPAVAELTATVARGADPDSEPDVTVEPLGDLEDARALWDRFAPATGNPFASWWFADLWWRHLGDERPLHLGAVHVDGEIVALLPVFEAGDELRFVGHVDADLLGPIGAPEHHAVALRALGDYVTSRGARMIADDMTAGSARWLGGTVVRRTRSPVIDLPEAGFDALLATRSANLRGQVRNRFNRLARTHAVTVRTADARTLDDDLATLFALHNARWSNTTSVFSGPRAELQRELAAIALRLGWLRLRVLELDDRPVAATYGLRVGAAEWFYQAGRDPAFDHARVGGVLFAATIRDACEEGAREFRMLRGDERYKVSWATRDAALETVLVDGR